MAWLVDGLSSANWWQYHSSTSSCCLQYLGMTDLIQGMIYGTIWNVVCLCHLLLAHMGAAAPYTSNCRIQMLPTSAAFWNCSLLRGKKCTGRNGPRKSLWKRKSEVLKQGGLEARACVSAMLCFSSSWISWSLPFYFSPPEELNRRLELK